MKIRLLRQQIKSREYRHQDFYQKISKKYLLHDDYNFAGVSLIFRLGAADLNQEHGEDKHHLLLFFQRLFYCWQNEREGLRTIANSYTLSMNFRLSLEFLYHQLSLAEQQLFAVETALCKRLLNREPISEHQMAESRIFRELHLTGSWEKAEDALAQKLQAEHSAITNRIGEKISKRQNIFVQQINPGLSFFIKAQETRNGMERWNRSLVFKENRLHDGLAERTDSTFEYSRNNRRINLKLISVEYLAALNRNGQLQAEVLNEFRQMLELKKETIAGKTRGEEPNSELSKVIGQWMEADRRTKSLHELYQLKSPLAESADLKQRRTQEKQVLEYLYRVERNAGIGEEQGSPDFTVDFVLHQKLEKGMIQPEILRRLMPFLGRAEKFPALPAVDRFYQEIWLHRKTVDGKNVPKIYEQWNTHADINHAEHETTINERSILSDTSVELKVSQKSEKGMIYPEILHKLMPFSMQNQTFPTLPTVDRFYQEIIWLHRKSESGSSVIERRTQKISSVDINHAERNTTINERQILSDTADLVLPQKSEKRIIHPEILRGLMSFLVRGQKLPTLPRDSCFYQEIWLHKDTVDNKKVQGIAGHWNIHADINYAERETTINERLILSDTLVKLEVPRKSEKKMIHPEILHRLMPFSVQNQTFPTLPTVARFYQEIKWLHRKTESDSSVIERRTQKESSVDINHAERNTTINKRLILSNTSVGLEVSWKSEKKMIYPEILHRLMPFSVQNQTFPTLPTVARFYQEIKWLHRKSESGSNVIESRTQKESSVEINRAERETTINERSILSDTSVELEVLRKSEKKKIYPKILHKLMPFSVLAQKFPTLPTVARFYQEIKWLHRKSESGLSVIERRTQKESSVDIIYPEILRRLMSFLERDQKLLTLPRDSYFYQEIWLHKDTTDNKKVQGISGQWNTHVDINHAERETTINERSILSDTSVELEVLRKSEKKKIYPKILRKLMPFSVSAQKFPTLPTVARFYQEIKWLHRKSESGLSVIESRTQKESSVDINHAERNTTINERLILSDAADLVLPQKSEKGIIHPEILRKLMSFLVRDQKFSTLLKDSHLYQEIWLHKDTADNKRAQEIAGQWNTHVDINRAESETTINERLILSDTSDNLVLPRKLDESLIHPEILRKRMPFSGVSKHSSDMPAVETRQYGTARQEHRKKPAASAGYHTESEGGREIQTIRAKVDSSGPVFERQEIKIQRMEKELTQQKKTLDEMVQQFNTTVKKENVSVGQMTERVLKEMQKQFRLEKVRRGFS